MLDKPLRATCSDAPSERPSQTALRLLGGSRSRLRREHSRASPATMRGFAAQGCRFSAHTQCFCTLYKLPMYEYYALCNDKSKTN